MSKQSEAKEKQGYVPKAVPQVCMNCAKLSCEMVMPAWMRSDNQYDIEHGREPRWSDEHKGMANLRCRIGGFTVKKMGACNEFEMKS
jgi:hypothetical protein